MDITLHKAAEDLRATLAQVDPETGALPEGFENALGLVKRKSAAVGAFILQAEREADFVEQHAKLLLERVKAERRRVEWLRGYLLAHMRDAGVTEISIDGIATIKRYPERDVVVDIWDEKQIPAEYFEPQPPKLSKQSIKAVLSGGADVPGARLVAKDRLNIR